MGPPSHDPDPRRRRTREALQSALTVLALRKRYQAIHIDDILLASGVGRSTFYEHYAGKDALLVATMDGALALLADLPFGNADIRQATALLAHFQDNRAQASGLLRGIALRVIRDALVSRIEARLERDGGSRLRLPRRLAAHALADGVLSPLMAWLAGEATCNPTDLAAALAKSSNAALAGMIAASG